MTRAAVDSCRLLVVSNRRADDSYVLSSVVDAAADVKGVNLKDYRR